MQGLILSCGKGSRLYPFTENKSKALIPYMGKTALYYQARKMKKLGIDKVTLFYNKGEIEDFKKAVDGIDIELNYEFVEIGWQNTWTRACDLFSENDVLIMNCDIMVDSDFNDVVSIHDVNRAELSIICLSAKTDLPGREGRLAYVRTIDGVISYYSLSPFEGATTIKQIGMSIVNHNLWGLVENLNYKKNDPWTESFIPLALKKYKVQFIEKEGSFQDIGTWEGIKAGYDNPLHDF